MGKCRHDWHQFNARDRYCQTCGAVGTYSTKRNTTFISHPGQKDYPRLRILARMHQASQSQAKDK